MATNANWTIVFDDKIIIKQSGDAAGTSYIIDDNAFWSDSKFLNIWAIQHGTSTTSDEVEYKDTTPNSSYVDANLGDINEFSSRWDSAHLTQLQSAWDNDNVDDETDSEKITRLGTKPTSYSS
jgi:hypothetical protein|tara:strand:+ start:243 stop:611 length:369 start_codon:yes stop_codon:yes gene_type:complete